MTIDIHRHVTSARFHRRKRLAAGFSTVALGVFGGLLWLIVHPPSSLPMHMSLTDCAEIALMVIGLALLAIYAFYRCPNCDGPPIGRGWLGFNPHRCPSCKTGLR